MLYSFVHRSIGEALLQKLFKAAGALAVLMLVVTKPSLHCRPWLHMP